LTGKRRVGKTELIKEFLSKKEGLYLFVDHNKTMKMLVEDFQNSISTKLNLPEYVRFDSFEELLDFFMEYEGGLIVAIDEFQRFMDIDPASITTLQKVWDLKGSKSDLMLITSGSSMGMMNKIFIESKAPLFKRADSVIALKPFTFPQVCEVLGDFGIHEYQEKLDIYTLFGGTIYYYRLMDRFGIRSLDQCFNDLIFNEFSPVRNEVRDILVEEFGKEHVTYYEILSAMAMGRTTKKEIGDVSHISATSLSPYLYNLQNLLQLIEYEIPVTEQEGKTKKGRYILKDNFLRFYFRFIFRSSSQYELGNYEVIARKVREEWNSLRGIAFEDIARDYLKRTLLQDYPRIGRYWDRKGNEIDVVAIDESKRRMMLIEVKARKLNSRDVDSILDDLIVKESKFPWRMRKVQYGIVAFEFEDEEEQEDEYFTWTLEDIVKGKVI
jgi:AAA+ ATPase superfamily predicted ATPase